MNYDNLKKLEYVYIADREASLLFHSLFIESYKKIFTEFDLTEAGKYYTDNTALVAHGMVVSMYRNKTSMAKAALLMKDKFTKNQKHLENLYNIALTKAEETDKKIIKINNEIESNNSDFLKVYSKLRQLFVDYFGIQVFPLLIERAFAQLTDNNELGSLEPILVLWREKTHGVQNRLETVFEKFLNVVGKKIKADPKYYSATEIYEMLNGLSKVDDSIINQRKEMYLMIWNWDNGIPYSVFTDDGSLNFARFLEKKCKDTSDNKIFKGRSINKGIVTGKVYIISKKKDFRSIPPDTIIVAKIVELDDFAYLPNSNI
ncbi:MAG: hypothetical protein AAB503_01875, partial [Patescibacteria group bacterium]